MTLFKLEIIQKKGNGNQCNAKALWQDELVAEKSYDCPNYDSDIGLYIAGEYGTVNGQVRNFSYIKK